MNEQMNILLGGRGSEAITVDTAGILIAMSLFHFSIFGRTTSFSQFSIFGRTSAVRGGAADSTVLANNASSFVEV